MSYVTDSFDTKVQDLLMQGAIGLLPTDTIYGISARALDRPAVERVHKLKKRDKHKPFVILISDLSQLADLDIALAEVSLALRYWPGELTIICRAPDAPLWLHKGTHTLAVRQPNYLELRELITQTGPLISTSANLQGLQPAISVPDALSYFDDRLDFYVGCGTLNRPASTIVKSASDKLETIRQGAVELQREDRV